MSAPDLVAVEYLVAWRREGPAGGYKPRLRTKIYQTFDGAKGLYDFLAQFTSENPMDWPCDEECDGDGSCLTCSETMERVVFLSLEKRRATAWEKLEAKP